MTAFLVIFHLLLQLVSPCVQSKSLGIIRYCRQLLSPSSTPHHLTSLFEAYDVIQDPSFRRSRPAWDIFDGIASDVETTEEGVVAGRGLVAKRAFQAGEVVALYPIHALGYANVNGRAPAAAYEPRQRRHPSPRVESQEAGTIVGTSDLVCFRDEARHFGVFEYEEGGIPVAEVDYTYAMLDPSERYVFDVNPSRAVSSMFVAHLVNDAAAADFSIASAAEDGGISIASFDEAAGTALAYLQESVSNFNVVMTPFGCPPLMAYVTVKPVEAGCEFLATYGLDYWLGKGFKQGEQGDDAQEAMRKRLEELPKVLHEIDRADARVAAALREAKVAVRSSRYATHTDLIGEAVADLTAAAPEPPQGNGGRTSRGRWWCRLIRRRRS